MIIYAAYSCIASIIVKICRTFIMITSNKITNYTTIIRKIIPSYYRKYTVFNKGVSIWNSLDEEIKNILLRKLQSPIS